MERNEDVPEYVKYHDLIEELKRNKEIKGLQRYNPDHILPALVKKTDQTLDKVVVLLDTIYGRTRTEKVKKPYKISSDLEKTNLKMIMI